MSSKSGSKYKNKYLLSRLLSYLKESDEVFVIISLLIASFIFFLGLAPTLKVALPVLFIAAILVSFRLKNAFLGFFLVSLFSLQFFNPNKYYLVDVLRSYEIRDVFSFQYGRVIGFGVNLSNVFLIFSSVLMASEMARKKVEDLKLDIDTSFLELGLFGIAFIVFGIGVALFYSPFYILSSVWTVQYAQLFLVAILVVYFYLAHKERFNLFYVLISFNLVFQFALSSLQFSAQATLGLPIEATASKQFFYGLDEIRDIFRVGGTYVYHNELALVTVIHMALLLPRATTKRRILYSVSLLFGFATLVLTQSRANWIGVVILVLLALKFFSKEIKVLFENYIGRAFVYLSILLVVLSFLIIPRVLLSLNAPYEGAGLPLRERMIKEGVSVFVANPLLGFGAGTNEYVLHSFFPDGVINDFPLPVLQAHLQFLLEFGVIGAILFIAPFYLTARKIINLVIAKRSFYSKRKLYIFSYFLGLFLINLHYILQNHYGIIEFPFLGLILGFGMIAAYTKT